MSSTKAPWVIILAAGEGSRVRSVTRSPDGTDVAKQFWRDASGESLLERALRRAFRLTIPERVTCVVARQHADHWREQLASLPLANVIVQPENRGTAPGLLLPLLHVLKRDPESLVVVMPSDHEFEAEDVLADALREALDDAAAGNEVVLLGIEPDVPETEFGWIVPQSAPTGASKVASFVEKPDAQRARELLEAGGLWSSFIMAGRARAFRRLFERALPALLRSYRFDSTLLEQDGAEAPSSLSRLYQALAASDFSRHVLEPCRDLLRVRRVPRCGWTDLGTPERIMAWIARRGAERAAAEVKRQRPIAEPAAPGRMPQAEAR